MQNEAGEFVDMYIPRRCDVSNQLIGAKDHASISLRLAEVDAVTGRMNGQCRTFNISGQIRSMGECDDSLNRLAIKAKMLPKDFCDYH
ncbi:40S ribosomal protein S21 [Echinococcus multilocularis]|uniref:40S ribosomal protein S21 n=1 Tax=Echinococcus multilocularis TaxID=6211 RepID=A0A068Y8B0_ECHMU|nr:40S ribosomal protein S21 [Echinococcus multilocularis]